MLRADQAKAVTGTLNSHRFFSRIDRYVFDTLAEVMKLCLTMEGMVSSTCRKNDMENGQ